MFDELPDEKREEVRFNIVDPNEKTWPVVGFEGETLMDAGIRHGVPFEKACGGNAECTTCHIYVPLVVRQKHDYEDADERELDALEFTERNTDDSRLGCQIRLSKSVY